MGDGPGPLAVAHHAGRLGVVAVVHAPSVEPAPVQTELPPGAEHVVHPDEVWKGNTGGEAHYNNMQNFSSERNLSTF